MLFALNHKNKVIGLFDNNDDIQHMYNGLSKFLKKSDLKIVSFYNNTIDMVTGDVKTIYENKDESFKITKEEQDEIEKINYEKNKLIKEKEQLQDKKNTYDVDLELYGKFKKILEENDNFEIPEMFQEKFDVFQVLEENDDVCFESFNELYQRKDIKTSYDDILL